MKKKYAMLPIIFLGAVPAIGITERLADALVFALITLTVTVFSAVCAWVMGKMISGRILFLMNAVISAAFITAAISVIGAVYSPASGMGMYIAVLTGNVILQRMAAANIGNGFKASIINSLLGGVSIGGIVVITALFRELLSGGTVFSRTAGDVGIRLFSDWFTPVSFAASPAGALILFGFAAALMKRIITHALIRKNERKNLRDDIVSGRHPQLIRDPETGKIIRRSTAEQLLKRRAMLEKQRTENDPEDEKRLADAEKQSDEQEDA